MRYGISFRESDENESSRWYEKLEETLAAKWLQRSNEFEYVVFVRSSHLYIYLFGESECLKFDINLRLT